MSVIASPIQQGPAPANTQTRIHNNTLKVASVGGGQNAVYHVVGGAITDNVTLSLPPVAADDTIATLSANNNWTGLHTFQNGLTSTGPIRTTGSINASGPITTNDSIIATGGITSVGPFTAQGNFNAGNLATPGTLTVGGASTQTGNAIMQGTLGVTGAVTTGDHQVNGTHTVTGTSTLASVNAAGAVVTSGSLFHNGTRVTVGPITLPYSGTGHLQLFNNNGNVADADHFGLQVGSTKGLVIATAATQVLGFYGHTLVSPQQPAHGNVFAGFSYGTNEANMLSDCYLALRNFGLLA